MDWILFYGYDILSSLIPFAVLFTVIRIVSHHRKKPCSESGCVLALLFAFYISNVYHFTNTGGLQDILAFGFYFAPLEQNYIPFSQGIRFVDYVLNIALFLPLGAMVPMLWKQMRSWYRVLILGTSFSVFIELTQLLNYRRTDVDDLILNVGGVMIGYGLYLLWNRFAKNKDRFCIMGNWELPVMLLLLFAGRFLLFHEMGLAKLLYGF